jgi:hypothetical protein
VVGGTQAQGAMQTGTSHEPGPERQGTGLVGNNRQNELISLLCDQDTLQGGKGKSEIAGL